jgi:hypothetical protein
MHPLRLFGWGLLTAAFLSASLETVAQAITHNWGSMPARDMLDVMAPDLFDAFRDTVDDFLHPVVWDYVILPLLVLPGWLLLSVPGGLLVWYFHPAPDANDSGPDSFPQASYDEIVAAAHEADEQDTGIPSKYRDLEEYDPACHGTQGMEEEADPALDPLYVEQADVVPPARHIPSGGAGGGLGGQAQGEGWGSGSGGSDSFGGGLNRPF